MPVHDAADPDRDWIRRVDDHAASRLRLLDEAEARLASASVEQAAADGMADRLERWRSQMLHERWGLERLTGAPPQRDARDRTLADALDRLARRLRGGAPLPPRWPRGFVDGSPPPAPAAMEQALDGGVPMAEIVARSRRLTRERFGEGRAGGWRMRLYAPLYLSSHCANRCLYCGFAAGQPLPRVHLGAAEAMQQAALLAARGFRHLLLVAGDFPRLVSVDYLATIVRGLAGLELSPALEVAALGTGDYRRLAAAGASGLTLYMETYDEAAYVRHHPRGPKVSFDWRLEALERAAEAGLGRLGLGVLLGLADPARDVRALAAHGAYLRARFPRLRLAFSLPRLHAVPAGFEVPRPVDDDTYVRLMAALRLGFPDAEIVLSTRERPALRQRLAGICVTQMSAGSSTVPGGYSEDGDERLDEGGQFPVADERSPAETAGWLAAMGHKVRWGLDEAPATPAGEARP